MLTYIIHLRGHKMKRVIIVLRFSISTVCQTDEDLKEKKNRDPITILILNFKSIS